MNAVFFHESFYHIAVLKTNAQHRFFGENVSFCIAVKKAFTNPHTCGTV
jgi:hypothetical protein